MPNVRVLVRLKPSLLDTEGRAVESALHKLGWSEVSNLRVGKLIEFDLPEGDAAKVRAMCDKLLANPVIEEYEIQAT